MKTPKSLYFLPILPLLGAIIRHYSPEWISDITWITSGFATMITTLLIVMIDFVNNDGDKNG